MLIFVYRIAGVTVIVVVFLQLWDSWFIGSKLSFGARCEFFGSFVESLGVMAVVLEFVEGYRWVVAAAIANVVVVTWMAGTVSVVDVFWRALLEFYAGNICFDLAVLW